MTFKSFKFKINIMKMLKMQFVQVNLALKV